MKLRKKKKNYKNISEKGSLLLNSYLKIPKYISFRKVWFVIAQIKRKKNDKLNKHPIKITL